eukprot:3110156-Pyramimonas_sp.AAC.1
MIILELFELVRLQRAVGANHMYDSGRLSSCAGTRAYPVASRHVGEYVCETEFPRSLGRVPLGNPTVKRPSR